MPRPKPTAVASPSRLEPRQAAILEAVVAEYIGTAQPVGSQHVAEGHRGEVSSATVRSRDGRPRARGLPGPAPHQRRPDPDRQGLPLLRRPAGRARDPRARPSARRCAGSSTTSTARWRSMLERTSGLLADLTAYAAVVVGPPPRLGPDPLGPAGRAGGRAWPCWSWSSPTARSRSGRRPARRRRRRAAEPGRGPPDRPPARSATADGPGRSRRPATPRSTGWWRSASARPGRPGRLDEPEHVFVGGSSRMARPSTPSRPSGRCWRILEQQLVVVDAARDVLDRGLSVAIGAEHGFEPLASLRGGRRPGRGRRRGRRAPSGSWVRPG